MQIDRKLADFPESARGGAIAIGNFDGVHKGHAKLVERLVERSKALNKPAIIFTFDPHPVRLLRPEQCPPPLTWTQRKADLLSELGVDRLIAYPTDEALLRLSARDFFELVVIKTLGAKAIVEGPNFYFGHNREGNIEMLARLTSEHGLSLDIIRPNEVDDEMISSSRIRHLIGELGDVDSAREMLTAPYRIRGLVTHGASRGGKIGFPTANLEGIDTLVPADGVYAGLGRLGKVVRPAAIHIGPNPTFGENQKKVEAHLLEHDEVIYGRPLEVDFLSRLRGVRSFDSPEELVEQVKQDVERTLKIAKSVSNDLTENYKAKGI